MQREALRGVVLAWSERGSVKGALVKQFDYLYENDIIEEEAFNLWENDVHDQTPGRQKALLQVFYKTVKIYNSTVTESGDKSKSYLEIPSNLLSDCGKSDNYFLFYRKCVCRFLDSFSYKSPENCNYFECRINSNLNTPYRS